MTSLFLILLALAVYFALASRERDAQLAKEDEEHDVLLADTVED